MGGRLKGGHDGLCLVSKLQVAILTPLAFAALIVVALTSASEAANVPLIGCPSDGQLGPQPAPHDGTRDFDIAPKLVTKLAYYYGPDRIGVLAPRSWHCQEFEGSNGESLFVTRGVLDPGLFFSGRWKGLVRDGVEVAHAIGGTSGRFDVAKLAARAFPEARPFVERVIAEGIEPKSHFAFGPFATDAMHRLRRGVVAFETPAHRQGLGTMSRFVANDDPIHGIAVLQGAVGNLSNPARAYDIGTVQVSVRLAPPRDDLIPAILHQAERDYRPGK